MDNRERYLKPHVENALQKKMAFIGGPRQVGKTTLALSLLAPVEKSLPPAYFNWDNPNQAAMIRKMEFPPNEPILIFDEIHKYRPWRNLIKGIYDTEKSFRKIVVTGSARLDYYRKGGDSLVGRYRYFRLHPFSLREITKDPKASDLDVLLKFGGFPEPLFSQKENELRLWQRQRISHIIRQDLRDLENVRDISLIEHLCDLLPERVGSILYIKSLREDLHVDHKTVERWLQILENLYICFRIAPFGSSRIRAVKKEKKIFLWDWSMIDDQGAQFENLVASQLLKYCHFIEDTEGYRMELRFLRDTDKREVDFVVLQDNKPKFAVECKTGEKTISSAIRYYSERTKIPHFYQVHRGTKNFQTGNISVLPFIEFCKVHQLP